MVSDEDNQTQEPEEEGRQDSKEGRHVLVGENKWFETFPGHKMTFLILKYKHRLLNILNTSTL